MTSLTSRAKISLPVEKCWEKLRDLSRAKHYVPGVTECVITTELREGVGASRRVTHERFGGMDETVIVWDEGIGFTIRLHKGEKPPTPFREASFRYELAPAEGGATITTRMSYELAWGPLGALLDRMLMRRISQGNVRDVAVSLARHYETDAPVPAEALPELRALAQ